MLERLHRNTDVQGTPAIPATSYLVFPAQVPDIWVWKEALVITPGLYDYKYMREFMQESFSWAQSTPEAEFYAKFGMGLFLSNR